LREISTAAELEALPGLAVILDGDFDVWQKRGGHWASHETAVHSSERLARYGPFIVLFERRRAS
jgi:hypothetical protein